MDTLLWIFLITCILGSMAVSVFVRRQDGPYDTIQRYPHVCPFGIDLKWQIWRDFHRGRLSEGMRLRHVLYGSTFSTKYLWKNCIYTIEPENIHAITCIKDTFQNFEKSEWAFEAAKHMGYGVLLNEGEAWKRSRTTLNPIFGSSAAEVPMLMEPQVRRLVAQMKVLQEEEGAVELHSLIDKFMLDVVTEFLFGKSAGCLENPRSPEGEEAIQFLTDVRSFDGPSANFIAVGTPARLELLASICRLRKMVASMQGFFRRKLTDIMTNTESASARSPPWSVFRTMKEAGIPEEQIQAELQNIFFASWYTTSALLANTIYILLRNRRVLERLRQEIQPLQGEPPTNQYLRKMEYLRLVVAEALRLYSPVTSHSRRAKVDTALPRGGGQDGQSPIVVRAGTTVVWSTYSLNRDPRWYGPDWAEFRPERWANPSTSRTTNSTADDLGKGGARSGDGADESPVGGSEIPRAFFMPFGSGPRTCLGKQMAQDEVSYVIVRLLQEFSLLKTKSGFEQSPFREAEAISFYNADGVWVSVK